MAEQTWEQAWGAGYARGYEDAQANMRAATCPCDDEAVERAVEAVNRAHESKIDATWRELLTVAFRAAGDTP